MFGVSRNRDVDGDGNMGWVSPGGWKMKDLLSMTLRTILRGVIGGRVCIHGFATTREATGRGCRGLDLALNRGRDNVVTGSVGRSLTVLWDGEARSR